MPVEIDVSPEDITYAEKILLGDGKNFDDERRAFIRNFETLDLQAVPGSGKTTALLAKLLILENRLPFSDGSGTLVISHTNAAVDEINQRIGKHCPRLFAYPNFVGTIQSFVNRFLATPFYCNNFGYKPYRIDGDTYAERTKNYYKSTQNYGLRRWLEYKHDPVRFLTELSLDNDGMLVSELGGTAEEFELKDPTKRTYQSLKWFKFSWMIKRGYLSFDDAYMLARFYLKSYPAYKVLLQKRFRCVFVDEMQDMNASQCDLLEAIFYDEGRSEITLQRIGDKNQSIYNGTISDNDTWNDRDTTLTLKGSHRLTKPIARVVDCFAINNHGSADIISLRDGEIKPHLMIYESDTIKDVIPTYAHRIKTLQKTGKIPTAPEHPFTAISWNTDWKKREDMGNPDKIRLVDYFPQFDKNLQSNADRSVYDSLRSYLLYYDKDKRTLESIRKNILNAFTKILRQENIFDEEKRNYTKKRLLTHLKNLETTTEYDTFKLMIYNWSIGVIKGDGKRVLKEIRSYIPHFLSIFEAKVESSESFIESNEPRSAPDRSQEQRGTVTNRVSCSGVDIEIDSVHAVKGQTHTATQYLESYIDRSYESVRLANQIMGQRFPSDEARKWHKHSTLMAYVGLSRPTHLLCLAVHKDRYDEHLADLDEKLWEIWEI